MNSRDKSPPKSVRRKTLDLNFKTRRQISRLFELICLLAFICLLATISYKLLRTYTPAVEAPRLEIFQAKLRRELNKKIDWHDHDKIQEERLRKGQGEQGKPGNYSHLSKDLVEQMYNLNGYNGALSDIISVDRSLPDIRHPHCKNKRYHAVLPSVSVIIPFHNEHLSTLIRTGRSVINRSPEKLLKEIIYVDDFSTRKNLQQEFDEYIIKQMPKTKVVRLPERKGLIHARLAGAQTATGDVLIFLDAHSEASVNWLPPLLDPIAEDYKTCVCPFIDVINFDTYEYVAQDEGARGVFNWELLYKRLPRLPEDKYKPAEPFASPVMAGGLFAISSRFFWELGGYDEGLDIWGGEQYELSFKIWMCGGKMLDAPCSRVGHIYRKFGPFPNPRKKDFVCQNFKRVAEVWMDEYKQYYYIRDPRCAKENPGDLSKQLALRQRLQCKSFKWFMEEIAFDLTKTYPLIEPPDVASGQIRNIGYPNLCVETMDKKLEMGKCAPGYWAQMIIFTWKGAIHTENSGLCWDVSNYLNPRAVIRFFDCHGGGGNQRWKYDEKMKNIIHESDEGCLDMDPETKDVFVTECKPDSKSQQWELQNFNATQNQNMLKFENYENI